MVRPKRMPMTMIGRKLMTGPVESIPKGGEESVVEDEDDRTEGGEHGR